MAKLPAYTDWKAPWEVSGEDFDADTARKLIYNLTSERDTQKESAITARTELREAGQKVAAAESDLAALQTQVDDLTRGADESRSLTTENLRLKVALDKGIAGKDLKWLTGATEDELNANADELVERFGAAGPPADPKANPRTKPIVDLVKGDEDPGVDDAYDAATPEDAAKFVNSNGWDR